MKPQLLALATLLPCMAAAQTYYYINSISVDPTAPTTSDAITITLHGDLSSTGAYIVSSSGAVVGDTVMINIVAADPGGFTVLVPHEEVIPIGTLPAGDYTIQVNGTLVWDMAPPPQHLFTVTGSTGIAPITPSAGVLVRVEGGQLLVSATDGSAVGELALVDMHGRIAARQRSIGNSTRMDLSTFANGVYVLWMHDRSTAQRVVVSAR